MPGGLVNQGRELGTQPAGQRGDGRCQVGCDWIIFTFSKNSLGESLKNGLMGIQGNSRNQAKPGSGGVASGAQARPTAGSSLEALFRQKAAGPSPSGLGARVLAGVASGAIYQDGGVRDEGQGQTGLGGLRCPVGRRNTGTSRKPGYTSSPRIGTHTGQRGEEGGWVRSGSRAETGTGGELSRSSNTGKIQKGVV